MAFGALGTPIVALAKVTGFSEITLGAMAGRILTPFCVLVPFWLVCAFAGWGGMMKIWPAILVAGVSFAIPQLLMSNLHGPWIVNVVASVVSMICLIGFLFIWHPKRVWTFDGEESKTGHHANHGFTRSQITRAWVPWVILSVIVFPWGTQTGKAFMNAPEKTFASMASWKTPPSKITNPQFPVTSLNNLVLRVPPVVPKPTKEGAVFGLNWLSATGTGILLAGILSGLVMGLSFTKILAIYGRTIVKVRFPIHHRRDVGDRNADPLFRTGRDHGLGIRAHRPSLSIFRNPARLAGCCANRFGYVVEVLFGSLQKISAQQVNVSPALMAAANTTGGVMGKMIDAQSIVVASTATQWYGHEGDILRYVFWHSIALASLVGIFVFLMAYVYPFTQMVLR